MTERRNVEQRFDEELRTAARSLVAEDLPRGVLDPAVGASLGLGSSVTATVRGRRALPGFAAPAVAVVVLLLATAVALAPGSFVRPSPSPEPSPTATPAPTLTPVFRTSEAIRLDLEKLTYTCQVDVPVATILPGPDAVVRDSLVCLPPADIGPFRAAVIVGESASGDVVEVHMKADFTAGDTLPNRQALAATLGKAAAVVAVEGSGNAVATWVEENLPALAVDQGVKFGVQGLSLKIGRDPTGSYSLVILRVGNG